MSDSLKDLMEDYRSLRQRTYLDDATLVPDEEMVREVFFRISAGEHLIDILKDPGMPSHGTFHRWINRNPAWKQEYLDAQEIKMHGEVEKTIQIADQCNPKLVKKAELQVKARQWVAERLGKKFYGDPKAAGMTLNGNLTINNNSIHALLTDGTNQHMVADAPISLSSGELTQRKEDNEPEKTVEVELAETNPTP